MSNYRNRIIFESLSCDDEEVFDFLLSKLNAEDAIKLKKSESDLLGLFEECIYQGKYAFAKKIVDYASASNVKINYNDVCEEGFPNNLLSLAVLSGSFKTVMFVSELKGFSSFNKRMTFGKNKLYSPFLFAVERRHEDISNFLLNHPKIKIDAKNGRGESALDIINIKNRRDDFWDGFYEKLEIMCSKKDLGKGVNNVGGNVVKRTKI